MTDLVAWLRQQLDTDEQATIRYRDGHAEPHDQWDSYDSCSRCIATAEATPYRDAEFGLRQVQAHRAILDLYEELNEPHLYEAIQHLAAIYRDRDGYQEEWSA